jgi:hypothetical protein
MLTEPFSKLGRYVAADMECWPAEVSLILSALDAGAPAGERRQHERVPYRVTAILSLFVDRKGAGPCPIYVRDASPRGLGFVANRRLPLGYGGAVDILAPDGRRLTAHCTLFRCREAVPGWFEGALYFNREQSAFMFDNETD